MQKSVSIFRCFSSGTQIHFTLHPDRVSGVTSGVWTSSSEYNHEAMLTFHGGIKLVLPLHYAVTPRHMLVCALSLSNSTGHVRWPEATLILHGAGLLELVLKLNFTYETHSDRTSCPDALDRLWTRTPPFALHCGTIRPKWEASAQEAKVWLGF